MDDKRVSGSPGRDPLTKNNITRQNNFITSVGNLSNTRCPGVRSEYIRHLPSRMFTQRDYSPGLPGNPSRFALSETRDTLNYETKDQPPFGAADSLPLSYSRVMMFMECPFRFFLRYLYGLPEAYGKGRKHNSLILRAIFNRYCGNSPTPLLFSDNLSRDMEQIEFGLQYLQSKEVVGLDVPFSLDRFSNPVPFDEPEAVFRGVGQVISRKIGTDSIFSGDVHRQPSSVLREEHEKLNSRFSTFVQDRGPVLEKQHPETFTESSKSIRHSELDSESGFALRRRSRVGARDDGIGVRDDSIGALNKNISGQAPRDDSAVVPQSGGGCSLESEEQKPVQRPSSQSMDPSLESKSGRAVRQTRSFLSESGGRNSEDVSFVLSHFKAGFGNPDWERLLVYAWALSRHGYDIGRVEWVSLSAGCVASREVNQEDLDQAGNNVIAWIRQIMESEFEPEAGDHCSYCLYHSLCPLMEKLDQQMQISDQVSLRETLNKSIALQEGAKKMKGLADEYLDREGIGEVKLSGYHYGKDEVSPTIRITSKEDALDTVLGLGDPFRFISFKNLAELVSYLPEESYEIKERLKPDRRFRRA